MRGEYTTALPLATTWHQHWHDTLGPDDDHTLWAASQLANAHQLLGHYQRARRLDEDTLARRRRVLGDDQRDIALGPSN